ncbi:MAG: hypothetical protein JF585_12845, partial [Burkholderiales bacterium]|nr:hypothetical protein [Burkholderiales bacterium]
MLRLGEALISLKILSPEDLAQALRSQTRNRNLPLGELLVNHGVISREELREALEIKRSRLPDDSPSTDTAPPDFQSTASMPLLDLPGLARAADPLALAPLDLPMPAHTPAPAAKPARAADMLLSDLVTSPAQLHAAIEAQGRMPMVRIGEALIALGYITETQLAEALASQGKDRKVPLGELLVTQGLITRTNLQTALARKMGYPQVDLAVFPIDIDALRKLPVAAALRLEM